MLIFLQATSYHTTQSTSLLRFLFILQALVFGVYAIVMLFLPHPPRWLQHVRHIEDAFEARERLGYSAAEAEEDQ